MGYRLLTEFEKVFSGRQYRHRASNQGDHIAVQLYEDLLALGRSKKLRARVAAGERVVNLANRVHGVRARRGDATFGEIVPDEAPIIEAGFAVGRGLLATVEVGIEVKILAKAMIKQIDRVIGDFEKQVRQFRRSGGSPIAIGVAGINWASWTISYEGDRSYRTTGRGGERHPYQEAAEAERRLLQDAAPHFDHFLILRYLAHNAPPFPFEWRDRPGTARDYGATLARVSRDYEQRF